MPVVPIRNDFPDWGSVASSVTFNPATYHVTAGSQVVAEYDMSNYQYGVLYVFRDNTLIQNDFAFQWLGTVGAESNIVSQSRFAVIDGGTVVIPFQVLTPTLHLSDVDASAYPYDVVVGLTLYTNPPYQHGYPGGIFAINYTNTILSGFSDTIRPDGCGPGQHWLSVDTGSTDFDLDLTIYPRHNSPIVINLATNQSGQYANYGITLPATQWTLDVTNNDADSGFTVMMARTPNPT